MTELSPVCHISPCHGWKHGSAGLVVTGSECRVRNIKLNEQIYIRFYDIVIAISIPVLRFTIPKQVVGDDGKNLGPNEDGEIWIKGPQIMKGYYKRPDATENTIDKDGWLHTGMVMINTHNGSELYLISIITLRSD